jgi:hypothetical protein
VNVPSDCFQEGYFFFREKNAKETKVASCIYNETLKSGAVSGAETVFSLFLTEYSALIKSSIPEINCLNPEIWPFYPRVLALKQKILAVYP